MQILIIRHGEAENLHSGMTRDAERRLTARGIEQTERAGQILAAIGYHPDLIWVSPYQRTQQTAHNLLNSLSSLQPQPEMQTQQLLIPEAPVDILLQALVPVGDKRMLLVSHQPLVSHLTARLSGVSGFEVPALAPASMVLLEGDAGVWGCFDILWHRHSPNFDAQS